MISIEVNRTGTISIKSSDHCEIEHSKRKKIKEQPFQSKPDLITYTNDEKN